MRTVTYTGTLVARSSISHVGDGGGRVHVLRRENVVTADGEVIGVPIVSGAVIRGRMRRLGAAMVHEALGGGPLPFNVVTALAQGGVLTETRTAREVLTGDRQARLRERIPLLGLMGVVGGGRMMAGRLMVSKAIPVGRETLHLLPGPDRERLTGDGRRWPSVYELMEREGYTVGSDVSSIAALVGSPQDAGVADISPMRFEVETLAAGTTLWHRVVGEDLTADEADCLEDLMRVWCDRARLGGGRGRGLGDVEASYERTVTDVMGRAREPERGSWRRAMLDDPAATSEALSWL
ncbi:hypothetical protein FK256_13990 [Actinomyces johnsonii]|jgi:hypothetical protein|uniref:Uncharacterized protein n=1 Tax=Actinomyces johnsonii TaxID=544581 RepID=A0A507ZZW3_9ACTO|nr:RAMP superfamily CRISPR-associated protein [Actinomyces johnsonii]KAA8736035.1 hypothetical protein F4W10_13365 [Actinomyces johnsonii]TQD41238.1 hypothetical protein FK256_13990 [Actinomyces johnsonii]